MSEARATPVAAGADTRPGFVGLIRRLWRGRPTDRVRLAWEALRGLPGGRWLFSRIVGRVAPYSGSIRAEVVELRAGYAEARMRDRRRLRNHLRCLHAIALANLAEFTGNLALAYSIPGNARFIVTRIGMEYFHKARGTITAVCSSTMPSDNTEREVEIVIELRDAQGTPVCRGTLYSLVGPVNKS